MNAIVVCAGKIFLKFFSATLRQMRVTTFRTSCRIVTVQTVQAGVPESSGEHCAGLSKLKFFSLNNT